MDIHSKERFIENNDRVTNKGVSVIMPVVDKMIARKQYKDVFVELGIAIVFQGDFQGLLTEVGASRDWLFYHQYANNHIDCYLFNGLLDDGFIRMLDESVLGRIAIR